jgi:hypothetical protein
MDPYDGPAVFRQSGADVEVGRCTYGTHDGGKGPEEWHGQFEDATPEHILEVGEATLILPSGEQGEIVITEYAYRLTGSGRGTFEGRGPVPA